MTPRPYLFGSLACWVLAAACGGQVDEALTGDAGSGGSSSGSNHSNALQEFTGPDGHSYIWVYLQEADEWAVGDAIDSPATYANALEYVTCFAAGQTD